MHEERTDGSLLSLATFIYPDPVTLCAARLTMYRATLRLSTGRWLRAT